MKKLTLAGLLFVFIQIMTNAQENYSFQFGRVTNYEATMKACPSDSIAEAVVIYEYGESFFRSNDMTGNFDLYMEKSIKIKILKQSGIKYGEFEIPYYYSGNMIEEVRDLEGTTYNYDNSNFTKSALNVKNIYDEKINENWRRKKFAMPDVREGSIIEMKYVIITPYLFNIREWEFQKKIPVIDSRFILRVIPYYEYTYIVKRITKFDEYSTNVLDADHIFRNLKYKEMEYRFGMKNLPAFRDEDFITSDKDYMIGMNFQLNVIHFPNGSKKTIMSTWPEISTGFLKEDNFGKYIKNAEKEAKTILPGLNLSGKTQEEQLKIITEYVKNKYNWNGKEREFAAVKVSDFMKQKTGSSAEINLFLIGLLKTAGIDAYPLLLSTRRNGAINPNYPFASFFNYVIAGADINGRTVYVDGTEPMLPYNELPERCINVNALVTKPQSNQWIGITQSDLALTGNTLDIRLNETADSLKVNIITSASASDGYNLRKIYYGKSDNLVKYLENKNIKPQHLEISNYGEVEKSFVFSYTTNAEVEKSFNKLFIAPFQGLPPSENIFKQTSRTLPLDLIYQHSGDYKSTIHIPEGYKIAHFPKNYENDGPFIKINYRVNVSGNEIEVSGNYLFKKNVYEARNYMALKITFDKIVSLFNEMIVLEH
jgi:hypothetical protein